MEDFVDVIDYEGLYKINQVGDILGVKRQRLVKKCVNRHGYVYVNLCKEGKIKNHLVHRLLCQHYISNPDNLPQVDHIDRNKLNNMLSNLRWSTSRDNCLNKDVVASSGEQNIKKTRHNTFMFHFTKTFSSLEEAKVYRDSFNEKLKLNG